MLNFLRNTYAVLRRELTRLAHQPMYFVLMLVLPVVSFAFFALLFNKGVARDIPIAVLDQDHTSLSRKVTQMIDDTATAMVSYGIQDMDEGERLMREGKLALIPSSCFGGKVKVFVFHNNHPVLVCYFILIMCFINSKTKFIIRQYFSKNNS